MEYVKCPSCGNDTPGVLSRCKQCGAKLPPREQRVQQPIYQPKSRAGFVTFWLWLCIVVSILTTCVWIYWLFSSIGLWSATPEPMIQRVATLVISLCMLGGYILLLNWRKEGFGILVGAQIISAVTFILDGQSILGLFQAIVPIVVLYLILQIPKNGRTCWSQLS